MQISEVDKALEELKTINAVDWTALSDDIVTISYHYIKLKDIAQNLVNALEAEKNKSNSESETEKEIAAYNLGYDNGLHNAKFQPKKSIWKPASELPTIRAQWLIKTTGRFGGMLLGYFDSSINEFIVTLDEEGEIGIMKYEIESYCSLTDYINNIEERLSKLESK